MKYSILVVHLLITSMLTAKPHFSIIVPIFADTSDQDNVSMIVSSTVAQSYNNYDVTILNHSGKKLSAKLIALVNKAFEQKIITSDPKNSWIYSLYKTVHAQPDNAVIVVQFDAIDENLLARLATAYSENDVFFASTTSIKKKIVKNNSYRQQTWLPATYDSFLACVFKKIPLHDFMYRGFFYTTPLAYRLPIMEMSGSNYRQIANLVKPTGAHKQTPVYEQEEQVLAKKKPFITIKESNKSDAITLLTYSKDRPMQLYAFLESAYTYLQGNYTIYVMYATSGVDFDKGYEIVKKHFPITIFLHQKTPSELKKLTLKIMSKKNSDYALLAVDDIIVKDYVDLSLCVHLLEKTGAYGFYLRMGTNITECYSLKTISGRPPLFEIAPSVLAWQFAAGKDEWRYMGTFDMTLYRKRDLKMPLERLEYTVPNACEAAWQQFTNPLLAGLCYDQSKIVNIPMNLVQSYAKKNRNMGIYTAEQLLEKFMQGYIFDHSPLRKISNKAPHTAYKLNFIKRANR